VFVIKQQFDLFTGMEKSRIPREDKKITRKEAIKKAGYAAFSAATMMLLLNDPARAQAVSEPQLPPPWSEGSGWD
jgi:hypothetical protein